MSFHNSGLRLRDFLMAAQQSPGAFVDQSEHGKRASINSIHKGVHELNSSKEYDAAAFAYLVQTISAHFEALCAAMLELGEVTHEEFTALIEKAKSGKTTAKDLPEKAAAHMESSLTKLSRSTTDKEKVAVIDLAASALEAQLEKLNSFDTASLNAAFELEQNFRADGSAPAAFDKDEFVSMAQTVLNMVAPIRQQNKSSFLSKFWSGGEKEVAPVQESTFAQALNRSLQYNIKMQETAAAVVQGEDLKSGLCQRALKANHVFERTLHFSKQMGTDLDYGNYKRHSYKYVDAQLASFQALLEQTKSPGDYDTLRQTLSALLEKTIKIASDMKYGKKREDGLNTLVSLILNEATKYHMATISADAKASSFKLGCKEEKDRLLLYSNLVKFVKEELFVLAKEANMLLLNHAIRKAVEEGCKTLPEVLIDEQATAEVGTKVYTLDPSKALLFTLFAITGRELFIRKQDVTQVVQAAYGTILQAREQYVKTMGPKITDTSFPSGHEILRDWITALIELSGSAKALELSGDKEADADVILEPVLEFFADQYKELQDSIPSVRGATGRQARATLAVYSDFLLCPLYASNPLNALRALISSARYCPHIQLPIVKLAIEDRAATGGEAGAKSGERASAVAENKGNSLAVLVEVNFFAENELDLRPRADSVSTEDEFHSPTGSPVGSRNPTPVPSSLDFTPVVPVADDGREKPSADKGAGGKPAANPIPPGAPPPPPPPPPADLFNPSGGEKPSADKDAGGKPAVNPIPPGAPPPPPPPPPADLFNPSGGDKPSADKDAGGKPAVNPIPPGAPPPPPPPPPADLFNPSGGDKPSADGGTGGKPAANPPPPGAPPPPPQGLPPTPPGGEPPVASPPEGGRGGLLAAIQRGAKLTAAKDRKLPAGGETPKAAAPMSMQEEMAARLKDGPRKGAFKIQAREELSQEQQDRRDLARHDELVAQSKEKELSSVDKAELAGLKNKITAVKLRMRGYDQDPAAAGPQTPKKKQTRESEEAREAKLLASAQKAKEKQRINERATKLKELQDRVRERLSIARISAQDAERQAAAEEGRDVDFADVWAANDAELAAELARVEREFDAKQAELAKVAVKPQAGKNAFDALKEGLDSRRSRVSNSPTPPEVGDGAESDEWESDAEPGSRAPTPVDGLNADGAATGGLPPATYEAKDKRGDSGVGRAADSVENADGGSDRSSPPDLGVVRTPPGEEDGAPTVVKKRATE